MNNYIPEMDVHFWGHLLTGFHSVYFPQFSVCFASFFEVGHTDLHSQLPGVQCCQGPMKHAI